MGTDYALKLYKRVHYQDLDLREPQLSDYYKRSVQQKQGEMIYVVAGTSTLGLAVSFFLCELVQNGKKKLSRVYYSPDGFWNGFWKGLSAFKKLAQKAEVPEDDAKLWLMKQAIR